MVRDLMTDDPETKPQESLPAAPKAPNDVAKLSARQAREAREAAALRENLKRRKASARTEPNG